MSNSYVLRPIVASSGRSGTTILIQGIYDALKPFGFKRSTTKQIQKTPRWKHVTKTHGFPPKTLDDKARVIWVFSDPRDSVCSYLRIHRNTPVAETFIPEAIRLTARNKAVSIEDICSKDIFQMEKRFDAFCKPHLYPVLAVRYETMWDNQDVIAEFLEIPEFRLPDFRARQEGQFVCTDEELKQIEQTYASLLTKIKLADDFKLWLPNDSQIHNDRNIALLGT